MESASIWQRFRTMCGLYTDLTAIIDGKTTLNYGELMDRVNKLAEQVKRLGCPEDTSAAIVLEPGCDSVIATLAMIKLGIMFLPVDTALSSNRINFHVKCCDPGLVITRVQFRDVLSGSCAGTAMIFVDARDDGALPETRMYRKPGAGVCQILTSGSTGNPKRVIYTQSMILHDVAVRTNSLKIARTDRFAQWLGGTSLPLMTLFLALLNGASLHIRDIRRHGDVNLIDWIREHRISVLRLTPTLFRIVATHLDSPDKVPDLRLVSTGGESLTSDDVDLFRTRFPRSTLLVNHLSATEYRVACQLFIDHDTDVAKGIVPVGYPVDDVAIDIIDETGSTVAEGVVGEIVVRGAFLSPGYVDSATGRTVEFDCDPGTGVTTYPSGDLGLRREDGCVEYRGRADRMIKISGYRVELDEIEAVLLSMPFVEQAAAMVLEENGVPSKLAAFVAGNPAHVGVREIRKKVFEELGLFGFPHQVALRENLPLTAGGKIDRRALEQELAGNPAA